MLKNNTPRIISTDEKLSVIEDWLAGETREDNAIKHNIGSGTVYNIVNEWSNSIGIEKADVSRELAAKKKEKRFKELLIIIFTRIVCF